MTSDLNPTNNGTQPERLQTETDNQPTQTMANGQTSGAAADQSPTDDRSESGAVAPPAAAASPVPPSNPPSSDGAASASDGAIPAPQASPPTPPATPASVAPPAAPAPRASGPSGPLASRLPGNTSGSVPTPAPPVAAPVPSAPTAPVASAPSESAPMEAVSSDDASAVEAAGKAMSQATTSASGAVPKPSVRQPLSEELEQEIEAALSGGALDAIMNDEATESAQPLESGSKHKGKVVKIYKEDVFIEIGSRAQGVVPIKSFGETPPSIAQRVDVVIDGFNETEGLYQMHRTGGAVDAVDWSQFNEGMVVEATVTGHNKGGLECKVGSVRGFIPASQISLYRVEDLSECVGQKFNCAITECKPQRRNLVLSRRAVLEREREESREQLLAELADGQVRDGTVRTIKDFGAFVDLGGVDGLLHVGQLSWSRVNHPSDLLSVGQQLKVKIQKIDPNTKKISLSLKDLVENPWSLAADKYSAGSTVEGKVTKIMDFGAFVELEPGMEGMVHISELAYDRVFRVTDVLQEGQEVEVKVLSVDTSKQRIALSLKAMLERPVPKSNDDDLPPESDEPPPPVKKRTTPLKGGLRRSSGGEDVGLNW